MAAKSQATTKAGSKPAKSSVETEVPNGKKAAAKKAAAPKKAAAAKKAAGSPEPHPEPSHDQIARRAYEIFLERGGPAFQNWLDAEAQLRRG